jgi:UDP-N-acetylglucosamine 2-epimerase
MPDEYGRKDDEIRRDMIDAKIKETNTHNFPFNTNQNKRLLKYEYPF